MSTEGNQSSGNRDIPLSQEDSREEERQRTGLFRWDDPENLMPSWSVPPGLTVPGPRQPDAAPRPSGPAPRPSGPGPRPAAAEPPADRSSSWPGVAPPAGWFLHSAPAPAPDTGARLSQTTTGTPPTPRKPAEPDATSAAGAPAAPQHLPEPPPSPPS